MSGIPYVAPGVSVKEISSPSANTSLSATSTVAVVGPAQGFQLETQQLTLASGTTPFSVVTLVSGEQFSPVGAGQLFVAATNAINPTIGGAANQGGYQQGVDFNVALNGTSNVATVTPIGPGAMAAGGVINFTYNVIPANYFYAQLMGSQSAIESTYGPAFSVGGIQTPLSAGAFSVIQGGQVPIVLQPLFVLADANNPNSQRLQPTSAQMAAVSTWQQTLYALRAVQGVNFIVPIIGQSMASVNDSGVLAVLQAVEDHIYYMETSSQPNEYIFGVFGEDSTTASTNATDATLQTHAQTLNSRYSGTVSQNLMLLAPASFGETNPSSTQSYLAAGQPLAVGGEYVAAIYAGMIASRPVTGAVTRQIVPNINLVNSYRDAVVKNADAQAGLTVLEQNGQSVQVRHAITLDNSSVENRELNVVRAKFHMMSSLIEVLNDQIIGRVPADGDAQGTVRTAVTQVLDLLQSAGELVWYGNIQTRLLANDPTTCEIRFSWLPAFPLNYINVIFSLDLSGASNITSSVITG